MKNVACIIARTNSKRLEKKVLKEINGLRLIEYIISKIKKSRNVDEIYLCTSIDDEDKILLEIADKNGIKSFAGSRESVISRMLEVAKIEGADNVIRITGDNIFTDEIYLDLMLKHHISNNVDYTRTEYLPVGVTSEVIKVDSLKKCYAEIDPKYSEYLLIYMFQPAFYKCQVLIPHEKHRHPDWTLTVDTPNDLIRTLQIVEDIPGSINYDDIVNICQSKKIDHLIYGSSNQIKLPANVILSYEAFRKEMEMRISNSMQIQLLEDDYKRMAARD